MSGGILIMYGRYDARRRHKEIQHNFVKEQEMI